MVRKHILASVAFLALLQASPAFAAGDVVGVNSAVKGDVTITGEDEVARAALVKDTVRLGEEVNSQRLSTLQVLLNDQTVFTVGPDCVLTIDKFVYDPTTSSNSMSANVKKGMFRFMSGNIAKSSAEAVTIDSPVASMGIRGTIVEGLVGSDAIEIARRMGILDPGADVDEDGATIFILRGPGQNTRSNNRRGEIDVTSGGKTVTVKQSGMATFVPSQGVGPSDPFMLPDDIYELFSKKLRTKPRAVNFGNSEPLRPDFYDPTRDMDWPEGDNHNSPIGPIGPITSCTPQDPRYPNC